MSQPQTNAELSVSLTTNQAKNKQVADQLKNQIEELGKKGDVATAKLARLGKTLETVQERNAGNLNLQSAKQAGGIIRSIGARGNIEARGEQSRKTVDLMFENNKALQDRKFARQDQAKIDRALIVEQKKELKSQESINKQIAAADKFRTLNPNFANMRGGGGGIGGFGRRLLGGGGGGVLGGFVGGLASGLGVGLGGMAVARGVGGVVNAVEQATAFDRQRVAAEKLAGSQEQLNELMAAYAEASGGAVSQATSLETVTRLLATGYAKTAPQLERFVRATRGAALSLGKPQENIAQETQLAISNTSVKRLDQIGLGIDEVTQRTEELRDSNKSLSREMAFGEAVLSLMEEKYSALSRSVEGQASGVEKLRTAWANLFLTLGQNSQGPVNTIAGTLAKLVNAYTLPQQANVSGQTTAKQGNSFDQGFNSFVEGLQDKVLEAYGFDPTRIAAARALQSGEFRRSSSSGYVGGPDESNRMPSAPLGRDPELQSMIDAAYDNIQQVEENANKSRLQEIENYESQREQIINNYGKMVVREEQDFVRQRARSLRDYERSIMDVMRDARDREEEMQEDLDKNLANAREDSNERISDMQEDFNENREKAEREHKDNMLKAAGQLDAIAVLEERKAFRRQQEEAKKQHDKAVENEKESLQERIDDALEAHQERLEDARDADEKRLTDMRVARDQQLADEDEDRETRLIRAAEDHQDQLAALDDAHQDRLDQIDEQMAEETQRIKDALGEDLAEAGFYIKGMTEIMNERKKLQEEWFDAMIERMEKEIELNKNAGKVHDPRTSPERIPGFASGGVVSQTGLAYLHAGEYVIPAGNNGGSYSSSNKSIHVENINIQTTPGMEYMVGDLVEEKLIQLLERV